MKTAANNSPATVHHALKASEIVLNDAEANVCEGESATHLESAKRQHAQGRYATAVHYALASLSHSVGLDKYIALVG